MLPSIDMYNNIYKYMFYIVYFLISFSFLFSFDHSNNQKAVENLKSKSKTLIDNENFELALSLYLKILDFEKNIYSEDSIEIAKTYDQIANLYIQLNN